MTEEKSKQEESQDHDQRSKALIEVFPGWFLTLMEPELGKGYDVEKVDWRLQEVFGDPPRGERRILDLVALLHSKGCEEGAAPSLGVHIEVESNDRTTQVSIQLARNWRVLQMRLKVPVLPMALFLDVALNGRGRHSYEEKVADFVVSEFSYHYLALKGMRACDHLEGDNLLAVAFCVKMEHPRENRVEMILRALQRIATSDLTDQQKFLLAEFVEAYGDLDAASLAAFQQQLASPAFKEVSVLTKTSFEKGIEKGIEKGQRAQMRRLLEKRFGALSAKALARLESCSEEELQRLEDDFLAGKSLADLGLDVPPNGAAPKA